MLGRIGKLLLTTILTELGSVLIGAGRGWLERKLERGSQPTVSDAGDGDVVTTPQGAIVTDASGQVISFSASHEGPTKKAPEAPVQEA